MTRTLLSPGLRRWLWGLLLPVFLGASLLLPPQLSRRGGPVEFQVDPGMSALDVSEHLERLGLVRSRYAFLAVAWSHGTLGRLRAGLYRAWPHESLWTLVGRLESGEMSDVAVTIPEGWNAREIAARVGPALGFTTAAFLAAVRDTTLADSLNVPLPFLEGYLFPDTYRFLPGTTPQQVVHRMVGRFEEIWGRRYGATADSLGLDRHEALTLASLIEAEARVSEERPRIAAVFRNRLREGMKLQSDPTVAYALGTRPDRIYIKDLAIESPYNTYLVYGLPPGPICSPGEGALKAALKPLSGCLDLYFVATGDGRHIFSRTNDDHNAARRRVAAATGTD